MDIDASMTHHWVKRAGYKVVYVKRDPILGFGHCFKNVYAERIVEGFTPKSWKCDWIRSALFSL